MNSVHQTHARKARNKSNEFKIKSNIYFKSNR